ncbi:hypothetical protein [Pedobacter metabolipauper]|uniref:Uncharacterized protein n=1 Tax=Pedobacter metabolipauper TaxID=425513 RepID=A0A4R6T1W8_9SPHI|nr:hypothetical protein [Pedobacter metabolipauper]TDQ11500.1 hypothetical protein ATK78_0623 [Pedobacter metabolipauper]
MSIKKLSKTSWKIEPGRVTIYPYGLLYIFAAIITVLFSSLIVIYISFLNVPIADSLFVILFALLPVVLFWGFATTRIEFDSEKGRMRKLFMGFLPVNSIPFSSLHGISPVVNVAGGYNYRMFRKDARYGKGIVVSSGYAKNDDPNAIAFVGEAVPLIHGYLEQHDTPADFVSEPINFYRFFNQEGSVYTVKNKKTGAILFGLMFIALGLWLTTTETDGIFVKIFLVAFVVFIGLIFINAAYTKITFDTAAHTIQRTGLVKFWHREYQLSNYAGLQTVRRSINFVYAGTDINMYFNIPEKNGKQEILTVSSFKKSTDIERFIQEVYQIMGI